MIRHSVLLSASLPLLAGCADLLDVQELSGIDAGGDADAGGGATDGQPDVGASPACDAAWIGASSGAVPPGAVANAPPDAGFAIYVCRASVGDASLPGKLLVSWGCYWGTDDGAPASNYEVLVPAGCNVAWSPTTNGLAPQGAFICGEDSQGPLYACRVEPPGGYAGELGFMGWSTNHACAYSYGSQALSSTSFDVLIVE
jgi:hypothetical protein